MPQDAVIWPNTLQRVGMVSLGVLCVSVCVRAMVCNTLFAPIDRGQYCPADHCHRIHICQSNMGGGVGSHPYITPGQFNNKPVPI
jgi:hypothetical protein